MKAECTEYVIEKLNVLLDKYNAFAKIYKIRQNHIKIAVFDRDLYDFDHPESIPHGSYIFDVYDHQVVLSNKTQSYIGQNPREVYNIAFWELVDDVSVIRKDLLKHTDAPNENYRSSNSILHKIE